jgi:hypothetical protein
LEQLHIDAFLAFCILKFAVRIATIKPGTIISEKNPMMNANSESKKLVPVKQRKARKKTALLAGYMTSSRHLRYSLYRQYE